MNLLAVWPWPYVSIPLSLSLLICMIEIIIHLIRLLWGWTGKCVQCWNSKELKNGAMIITSSYGCSWSCQLLLTLIPNEGSARLRWGWQVVKTSTHSPTYCSRHCTSDRHNRFSIHPCRWQGKTTFPGNLLAWDGRSLFIPSVGISAFVCSMSVISLLQYSLDNISMLPMESVLEQFLSNGIIIFLSRTDCSMTGFFSAAEARNRP